MRVLFARLQSTLYINIADGTVTGNTRKPIRRLQYITSKRCIR